MPKFDIKTAETRLRKDGPANLYYIYGQNVNAVETLTKKIIKAAVGDNEDLALTRLAGETLNVPDFRDMIEMMPMMTEYNCILINDFNCEEQREDTIKLLCDALKNIPPYTVVILNVTGFEVKRKYDPKNKRYNVGDKNKKIADIAEKNGILVETLKKTADEMAKDIASAVSARGGAITLPAARELAEICMLDTLAIKNEVEKLCAYTQGKEITPEIIRSAVHTQSAATIYDLADHVVSFNKKAAFELLNDLMQDKKNRGGVLGNITSSFIDIYRIQCARASGKTAESVKTDFEYFNRGFIIDRLWRNGTRVSLKRLRNCLDILRDTTMQLNSSSIDEKIVLEEMLTKMLMTKN